MGTGNEGDIANKGRLVESRHARCVGRVYNVKLISALFVRGRNAFRKGRVADQRLNAD